MPFFPFVPFVPMALLLANTILAAVLLRKVRNLEAHSA